MTFRAKCWVKHGGGWAKPGETFEADSTAGLDGIAEAVEQPTPESRQEAAETPKAEVSKATADKPKPRRRRSADG